MVVKAFLGFFYMSLSYKKTPEKGSPGFTLHPLVRFVDGGSCPAPSEGSARITRTGFLLPCGSSTYYGATGYKRLCLEYA